MSTAKSTAFVPKPTAPRYRRGKAPTAAGTAGADLSDSDSEDSDDDEGTDRRTSKSQKAARDAIQRGITVAGGAGKIISVGDAGGAGQSRGMKVALRDVKVEEDGAVIVGGRRGDEPEEEEESSGEEESSEEEKQDRKPVFTRPGASVPKPSVSGDQESSEYETDSEEEEEEEKVKPVYRPTFVPKRARETVLAREAEVQAEEEVLARKEEEMEARKKESRDLVGESIRRGMAERELTELIPDVDDTDDLDPTSEFDEWRLRELSRLARDKETSIAREEEREEIERRKAMPEEERLREDMDHVRRQEEEKKANRGERGFLEKFWHKGAFHQDDEILKRNYNVKLESSVDISSLPKIMQVKNYGKMSRSKYTHLKDQDTTQEGWDRPLKAGGVGGKSEGCFNCGGPHLRRDCPNNNMSNDAGPSGQSAGQTVTGTNSSALGFGSRHWGSGAEPGGGNGSATRDGRDTPGRFSGRESRDVQDDDRPPRVEDRRHNRREHEGGSNGRDHDHRDRHGGEREREQERGSERNGDMRASRRDERDQWNGDGGRRDERERERERYRSRSPRRESRRYEEERR